MYPDLQAIVGAWEFEVKFKAAKEDNKDNFENDIKNVADKFGTIESIQAYDPKNKNTTDEQIAAYTQLKTVADEYGMTIDQLTNKMFEMGLIES